jgi:hypothetical protein
LEWGRNPDVAGDAKAVEAFFERNDRRVSLSEFSK